jgi:malate permease and related proteins
VFNLALVFGCLIVGTTINIYADVPRWLPRAMNGWVLGVALPALVLRSVHGLHFERRLFIAAGTVWLVFLVAAALAILAVRFANVPRARAGALGLTAGLGNTAFVGVPLVRGLFGDEAVPYAVAVDQLGSFLLLPLLALPFAALMSGTRLSARELLTRLLGFPPLLAFVAALLLRDVSIPDSVMELLRLLSLTLSPVALLAVGLQLELGEIRVWRRELVVGLGYKLLVAPAIAAALLWVTGPGFDTVERVAICQCAMAPMVTGAVIASQRELEPRLASLMVGVGVLLSLITVPLWWAATG